MTPIFPAILLSIVASTVLSGTLAATPPPPGTSSAAGYRCTFTKDGWSPDDWMMVKKPAWDHLGGWIQTEDCIVNETPVEASEAELLNTKAIETYTGMLLKRTFTGDTRISATMSFDHRMAPAIVIADTPGISSDGRPAYSQMTEIVMFDEGVNVWNHEYKNGRVIWTKLSWHTFKLEPKKKYEMTVTVSGQRIEIKVDGHTFGCTNRDLPKTYRIGLNGDEGINRFYAFTAVSI